MSLKITLSPGQLKKLARAQKRGDSHASIRLSAKQLKEGGNHELQLHPESHKKVQKALRAKKPRGAVVQVPIELNGGFLATLAGILAPTVISGIANAVQGKNFFTGQGTDVADGMACSKCGCQCAKIRQAMADMDLSDTTEKKAT